MISQHFKSISLLVISIFLSAISIHAQIGYQVSLLNTATGEPRANEKVTAKIELSNSDGEVVYSETQTGVTNEFGVLSLTIGNAQSLSTIDWSKYPMFISVSVDNVLIGKTQVMSVPYANAVVPLSKDILIGTWSGTKTIVSETSVEKTTKCFVFNSNGNLTYINNQSWDRVSENGTYNGYYTISGDDIYCFYLYHEEHTTYQNDYEGIHLKYLNGKLYVVGSHGPSLSKQ